VILVDAGRLVAFVSPNDQHHAACIEALRQINVPMATVWPVLAEAMHLLRIVPDAADAI
jgi:predicted nucleic acid-binding protein